MGFLNTHFVFFDYEEPLIFFLLDYAAVIGLFVFIVHYLVKWLKWLRKGQEEHEPKSKRVALPVFAGIRMPGRGFYRDMRTGNAIERAHTERRILR